MILFEASESSRHKLFAGLFENVPLPGHAAGVPSISLFRRAGIFRHLACIALHGVLGALILVAAPAPQPRDATELYIATNIWSIHLTFSPDQWAAIEPVDNGNGMFGGPRGQRGPGGGNRFGLSVLVAPGFLTGGDQDGDGKLSRAEFTALGEKWFTAWDTNKTGRLSVEQLRSGLNAALTPPGGGGPFGGRALQGAEGKRNGVASMAGIEFNYVHADLDFNGQQFKDVAVRYKGNGTFMEARRSLKRSLKVELDKYVKGRSVGGVTTLNLHNNITDVTEMNEPMAHRLFRDARVPAPRTAYSRVYVTVPGKFNHQYFGLYSLVEDIGKGFAEANFGSREGAIFKPVTPSLFSDLGNDWARYKQTYDPKGQVSTNDTQRVIECAKFVSHSTDAEFAARLGDFIDLQEFARYLAIVTYVADIDGIMGPGQNFYLHLDAKTRRFSFIAWDQDHSWGQFPGRGSQEQRENLSILHAWQGNNPFLERVMKVEGFRKQYLAVVAEFSRTLFQPARFDLQVDSLAAVIRPAIIEESPDKAARFDQAVAGNVVERGDSFGGRGGFGGATKPIKPFVRIRSQSISDQLAGKAPGMRFDEGGPGRGGRRGGPGDFLGQIFLGALDADHDGSVSHDEFTRGFTKWFGAWSPDGLMTDEQLRAGIDRDLVPRFDGSPPGRGPE